MSEDGDGCMPAQPGGCRLVLLVLAIAVAVAACGSGSGSPPPAGTVPALVACSTVYAPGRAVQAVIADGAPTCDDHGQVTMAVLVSRPCPPGGLLYVAEPYGWGRDGGTWQGRNVPTPECGP